MKIVGYSSYSHVTQEPFLKKASSVKSQIVEQAQQGQQYGSGLDTLLIFYNFEAVANEFAGTDFLKTRFEVQRYNKKEESLRVNVFVGFDELTSKTYEEQIVFYFNTTLDALSLVKRKIAKNRYIRIDFDRLQEDIRKGFLTRCPWLMETDKRK